MSPIAAAVAPVGVAGRAWRAAFAVSGADARSFLQRLLTADLSGTAAGSGQRSLLLSGRGHIVADLDIWAEEARFVIATHADALPATLLELGRRVLRSDVTLRPLDCHALAVHGADAAGALRPLGIDVPPDAPYAHVTAFLAGAPLHVRRTVSVPYGLEVAATDAAVISDLLQRLTAMHPAVRQLDAQEVGALRIEAGLPEPGAELTGEEFPQEAGLEAAVSFDKGCYLGQETVARIRYRGHVNRLLRGLRLGAASEVHTPLLHDARRVGEITSVAHSARFGDIALGWVQRAHAAPGTRLQTGTGGEAEVVTLPFA